MAVALIESEEVSVSPDVLIVGAGVAGIQAALEIANSGHRVYLVERESSVGGHMVQFDKTFPTLDCPQRILTPKMSEVGSHRYIKLLTYSEVEGISGSVGDFKVKIRKKARYVDEDKCTGCGICQEKCPLKVDSEFDLRLGKRKVICTLFPQAVPNVPVIDKEHCVYFLKGRCRVCEKFCEAKAIDFGQEDQIIEVEVGSIIIATGYDLFDPAQIPQYGYGRYENVLTALEFERISSSIGPTGGEILLKDGRKPGSVAIIHCVGSRDRNYREYCSRICCMYAVKFSSYLKEKTQAKVYQMYIDMRCFGEGYEEFYKRVSEEGVNFIRGKVTEVVSHGTDGKLKVSVMDTLLGKMVQVPVDMVILCPAIVPRQDAGQMAKMFNINLREDGFFRERHIKLDPMSTSIDGIFISGCCQSPKDIPDTVAQASGAAARVLSLIGRGKITVDPSASIVGSK
jgi:heterodisulfide reductase subunit A